MEEAEPPECPVCLEPYDAVSIVPRVIACGHTVCQVCLGKIPNPFPDTIRCPICTALVRCPSPPTSLPKNLDLLHFSIGLRNRRSVEDEKVASTRALRVNEVSFPFALKSWSDDLYRKWKKWIISRDFVSVEKASDRCDYEIAVSGKFLGSCDGDYGPIFCVLRDEQELSLVRIGVLSQGGLNSFRRSYESRILMFLSSMEEEERNKLVKLLNATLKVNNIVKACGLWYNEDGNGVYVVFPKLDSAKLIEYVCRHKEKLKAEDVTWLALLGMEMCEILCSLHSEGLILGLLSQSCFTFSSFGRISLNLFEIINAFGELNVALHQAPNKSDADLNGELMQIMPFVLISPELLRVVLARNLSESHCRNSEYEVGYSADAWSLACSLVWLIVGSSFTEELSSFLHSIVKSLDESEFDYYSIYMSFTGKISSLLDEWLGPEEFSFLKEILLSCLDFAPLNRPPITDLWKCLRELVVKSECDAVLLSTSKMKKETSVPFLVIDLFWIVDGMKRDTVDGLPSNDENDKLDVDGDAVDISVGNLKSTDLNGHRDCVTGLATGGGFLFSSSYDKAIKVWSLQDFTCVYTFKGHEHRIMALDFVDGDEPLCISGDSQGFICIWKADLPFSDSPIVKLDEKKDWRYSGIHAMVCSGRDYLYTGGGDKLVKAWSLQDYTLSCAMSGHDAVVTSLELSHGVLYSGSWDGTVRLWSQSDHTSLAILGVDRQPISSVVVDRNLVFVGHENGSLKIWRDDVLVKQTEIHKGAVFCLCKKGGLLFSGGLDRSVNIQEVWEEEEGEGVEVRGVGDIPCKTAITALLYCHGKLYVGQAGKVVQVSGPLFGQRWRRKRISGFRRVALVVEAQLNSLSVDIGLDSQSAYSHESSSHLPWAGPLPGDISEVEAYCRIFRAAERFHNALMDALCNPITGECSVSYAVSTDDESALEDKIVSVLGCMICLLNKGREDVLLGRSSIMSSFRDMDGTGMDDNVPPLANFRSEMKSYCESLHVALENNAMPGDETRQNVWRKLQRLKNVCYDSGFPRADTEPDHTLLANWGPVYFSNSKGRSESQGLEVAFWKGSQVTEESLQWLLEKGFKTIIDLRAETVKDNFYESVLDDAVMSLKIELVKLPVEMGTAPSMDQVERFAAIVSDSRRRPIYVHSKEGKWRTSSMVSRWRQFMDRKASPRRHETGFTEFQAQDSSEMEDLDFVKNSANDESPASAVQNQSQNDLGADCGAVKSTDVSATLKFSENVKPLESQLPPPDVFSKREMSKFFTSRKISPVVYFSSHKERLEKLPSSESQDTDTVIKSEAKFKVGLNGEDVKNESISSMISTGDPIQKYQNSSVLVTRVTAANADDIGKGNGDSTNPNNYSKKDGIQQSGRSGYENYSSSSSDDENMEGIEGDMCASTTGVVRVQSRKKAEMFLVRTDGFSCSREKVTESSLAFTHPSTQQQMLLWKSPPKTVLLLKKLGEELMDEAKEVATFLHYQEKMNVLVEPEVHDILARIPGFGFVQTFYSQDTSNLHERVDLVTCLGGDGVILHASNLFRGAVPPVVSFNLGSLGFLTSHTFDDYKSDLRQVICGNKTTDGVYITLRMRLRCEIFRNGRAAPGKIFDVLNEIVVDRGSNPYLSKIECFEHDRLITKVQGDGVIVATPTGSTAYSTAAGGSMVHPNVPCMLFTPICPHSLSFRPVILPDSARLELKIPEDARSNAWVSFDGKRRQQLSRGDSVKICMSQHPLPTVNKRDQTGDWFRSLIRCLNWNERLDQRAL
ncbi:hypothetical protein M569_07378 [Genlisea aurea]|uniref:NAD(+) kinase n=1 Tax=Genlisea aurea TaxID=192259 RepID=S8E4Z5_9LAMI|nr:hypothetical protein M569_07378 [Genlisea aurea]